MVLERKWLPDGQDQPVVRPDEDVRHVVSRELLCDLVAPLGEAGFYVDRLQVRGDEWERLYGDLVSGGGKTHPLPVQQTSADGIWLLFSGIIMPVRVLSGSEYI